MKSLLLFPTLAALIGLAGCRPPQPAPAPGGPAVTRPGPSAGARPGASLAKKPSIGFTTGAYEGCPPKGDGGDRDLNRLKNRDVAPDEYEPLDVWSILQNRPEAAVAAGQKPRRKWSEAALAAIREWEDRAVSVEGYLLKVKQEEPESCNCHIQEQRDYHMWLGVRPETDRSESLIVEVSPRVQRQHENWRLRILSRLAKDRARVRISGWLMWDQEHPEQLRKTRGTLWEIHPIHRIEVWSGGVWREL